MDYHYKYELGQSVKFIETTSIILIRCFQDNIAYYILKSNNINNSIGGVLSEEYISWQISYDYYDDVEVIGDIENYYKSRYHWISEKYLDSLNV